MLKVKKKTMSNSSPGARTKKETHFRTLFEPFSRKQRPILS